MIFLPLTLHLGMWQMDRAEEKVRYLEKIEARESMPLSVWQATKPVSEVIFQPYKLVGHYLANSFLLDNRIRDGKVGYEVLTPFKLFTGETVLINRGWVAAGKYRQELPEIKGPEELVSLEGHFYQAQGNVPVLKDVPQERGWPRRIQQVKWPYVEAALGFQLTEQAEFRLADDQVKGAYLTGWPKTSILPEKHTGYAYQWFALSFALIVLTVLATIKIRRQDKTITTIKEA